MEKKIVIHYWYEVTTIMRISHKGTPQVTDYTPAKEYNEKAAS